MYRSTTGGKNLDTRGFSDDVSFEVRKKGLGSNIVCALTHWTLGSWPPGNTFKSYDEIFRSTLPQNNRKKIGILEGGGGLKQPNSDFFLKGTVSPEMCARWKHRHLELD